MWAQARERGLDVPSGITPNESCMRRKHSAFSWEMERRIFLKPPTARDGALDARLSPDQYEIARQQWHMKWPSMRKSALIRCAGSPKLLLLRVRQNGRSRRSIPFAGGMMFDASRARFENCLGIASTPDAQSCGLSDLVGSPGCMVCSRVLTPIHKEKLAES